MSEFQVISDFKPMGDQPQAIETIEAGLRKGLRYQTLKGVTGSGKTFTMAHVIQKLQRPTLIIANNKTLAAQLATELKDFLPNNAVEYFVSYYDYYQPEAYVPQTDTYIEKDASINDEIDKLRNSATKALLTRRDVVIVASVSCIFGLGSPDEYRNLVATIRRGKSKSREALLSSLIDMQYERNDMELRRGTFRVKGDTIEIYPAYEEIATRIEFWGEEIERIVQIDQLTGEVLLEKEEIDIYPAKHFLTSRDKMKMAVNDIRNELTDRSSYLRSHDKLLEAARLESRTNYDIEMMLETGYCAGIENYSRHIDSRKAGSAPWVLLNYFPEDFILFVDESHVTIPQIRGMYKGDQSRKQTLVNFGFRLPSALDNRPLNFDEFEKRIRQIVFVSATPGPYEMQVSNNIAEQVIRPTGLIDPSIEIKPTKNQVDNLLEEVKVRIERGERTLITTLTKRMSEELADFLKEMGIKTHYLHSDIETLERTEILRDLRLGVYDVIVGINLLREGLDLPEVSLVAILDADKEGFLRSETSLVQTIGRAARHENGSVIMYADTMTGSMRQAIDETYRRRRLQSSYNTKHGIVPSSIRKAVKSITDRIKSVNKPVVSKAPIIDMDKEEANRLIKELESQMKKAALNLEFEKAALLRDEIVELRKNIQDLSDQYLVNN